LHKKGGKEAATHLLLHNLLSFPQRLGRRLGEPDFIGRRVLGGKADDELCESSLDDVGRSSSWIEENVREIGKERGKIERSASERVRGKKVEEVGESSSTAQGGGRRTHLYSRWNGRGSESASRFSRSRE
jgi:hypothetical protein